MSRNIGMYLRLSKAEKKGNISSSIERQRVFLWDWINSQKSAGLWCEGHECKQKCEEDGVPEQNTGSVLEYMDDGYSGMAENRPGYERLLAGILTGKIGTVLVKDFSRLSRDHLVLAELREYMFPLYDVRLVAPGDGYDSLYTSGEELQYGFRSLFYEYYCHDISRKVKAALQAKKENGEYATGAVPFGYKSVDGIWYLQPEEADILRFLFCEVAAGKSYQEAGNAVGMDGARVWYLLHNPVYLGYHVWHRYENHVGRRKKTSTVKKEDWNIRRKAHEAVIDEEIFWKVQNRKHIACNKSSRESMRADGHIYGDRHIFSGITKCRDCGRALVRGRRKKEMLCCKHCIGKEEIRIAEKELLEICRLKIIEQYGEKPLGDNVLNSSASSFYAETVRMILQELFRRIEVDRQGNVWIWWNFTD